MEKKLTSEIRVRMGSEDAHYGGNLVDGSRILQLFGDNATELCIKKDGDEGLFLRYDEVEFLEPVFAGDFIEAKGEILESGNTSRKMSFEAKKVITQRLDISATSCDHLEKSIVVARAKGFCVVPKKNQRNR